MASSLKSQYLCPNSKVAVSHWPRVGRELPVPGQLKRIIQGWEQVKNLFYPMGVWLKTKIKKNTFLAPFPKKVISWGKFLALLGALVPQVVVIVFLDISIQSNPIQSNPSNPTFRFEWSQWSCGAKWSCRAKWIISTSWMNHGWVISASSTHHQ